MSERSDAENGSIDESQSVDAPLRAVVQLMARATSPVGDEGPPSEQVHGADSWFHEPRRAWESTRLGQLMVERGLVTDAQLEQALSEQRRTGKRMGETLLKMGAISSLDLARVLADHLGLPFVDLRSRPPDLVLAALIPEQIARRYCALPVARWSGQLVVAMANPNDVFALDDLRVLTGQPVIPALAEPEHLQQTLDRAYQHVDVETSFDDATADHDEVVHALATVDALDAGPVVRLVDALLEKAANDKASDLHIEPTRDSVVIRERIDGVLHDASEAPVNVLRPLVSRIKLLGGLDIAETRRPQDGRFSFKLHTRTIDVRVAVVPTTAGESVVLRLLDPIRNAGDVASLGLSPDELARFEPAFRASQGAVVVTGPTGSGKTSTLYAIMDAINTREKSIVSVEDPVEYRFSGVKQIQVHPKAGVTFPIALRSILRVDPDVILIGEVRDVETARIAADASITGHLVLSTMHATRTAASPGRLIDMGLESYLVASALSCLVAQRLVRKLCEACARPIEPAESITMLRRLKADETQFAQAMIRVPVGCPSCRGTGYEGRRAIYEIMPVSDGIARLIVERAATADIERLAIEEGMHTLRTAALERVIRGELSVDEMLRVIP
jgi:type IV pilus assembly protein PilB